MNFLQILGQALSIYLSKSVSFKVAGKYLVSVTDTNGTPVHLNLNQAVAVLYLVVAANAPGTFQSGDVTVNVTSV